MLSLRVTLVASDAPPSQHPRQRLAKLVLNGDVLIRDDVLWLRTLGRRGPDFTVGPSIDCCHAGAARPGSGNVP
jgi:hypothetical protein